MSTFKERLSLTEQIEQHMESLFVDDDAVVSEFGCEHLIGNNKEIFNYLKEPEVNQKASSMIIKSAPDYILFKKSIPRDIYFIDIKHSVAPVYFSSKMKSLQEKNEDLTLTRSRVGIVAREALLSYRRFYPNSIIIMACPYNKKLLMAQFADKIRCLHCYNSPNRAEYDCNNCPSKNGGFFDIERDNNSAGSQTPMTNVDLDSFLPIGVFFRELGIGLKDTTVECLMEKIKKEPIDIDKTVYPEVRNKILYSLNRAGCDWIDYRVHFDLSTPDLYHIDLECSVLKNQLENSNNAHIAYNYYSRICRSQGNNCQCFNCVSW